jgi:DNA-binding Xre family transcriptional regulator
MSGILNVNSINFLYNNNNSTNLADVLNTTDSSLNSLTSHVSVTDSSLNSLTSRVSITDSSLNDLTSHVSITDSSLNSLTSHVSVTDSSLNSLTSHVSITDSSLNDLTSHVSITDSSLNKLDLSGARVCLITTSVSIADSDISLNSVRSALTSQGFGTEPVIALDLSNNRLLVQFNGNIYYIAQTSEPGSLKTLGSIS